MSAMFSKLVFGLALTCCGLLVNSTSAQQPVQHELVRGDLPPGLAANYFLMNNRSLGNYVQPVQLITPQDCTIEIGDAAGFGQPTSTTVSVGLMVGPVYRFKISNLPIAGHQHDALYPSVELINRTYPPEGLRNEFPVQIMLTRRDLELAHSGRLVTRVIYLEDPRGPFPHQHRQGAQPSFEIGGGEDPLEAAEELGRPMAILRLGSRVPSPQDVTEQFNFGTPPPEVLPLPSSYPVASRDAATNSDAVAATHSNAVESNEYLITPRQGVPAQSTIRKVSAELPVSNPPVEVQHQQPVLPQPSPDATGFVLRDCDTCDTAVVPLPIGTIESAHARMGYRSQAFGRDRLDPAVQSQEYIFDGNDREARTHVDSNWNVYGLDSEDTVGHFDTLDGRRIVTPSNRVAIYAPRFGSVRRIDGAFSANVNQSLGAFEDRTQLVQSAMADMSSTTKQHVALNYYKGNRRASGLIDRTRGVAADNTTHLFGFRNAFQAYNNSALIRSGRFHASQGAAVQQGIQSAVAWESDMGLQVVAQGVQPIIVKDVRTVQELVEIESEDGTAILRVVKVASKMAAQPGEEVEFTIRFDNISAKRIGNVTIMDSLTRRLEYVEGTAESTLQANFLNEVNEDESLLLRWEVIDPLEPGEGGVIRFKCRAR